MAIYSIGKGGSRNALANPFSSSGGGGGLVFVDKILVTADTTTVTFGSGGDGEEGAALDGDSDEEYLLTYMNPAFNPSPDQLLMNIRPNGTTTFQSHARQFGGTGTGEEGTSAAMRIASNGDGGNRFIFGQAVIYAKSGTARGYVANSVVGTVPATISDIITNNWAGIWSDDSANLTSLVITSTMTDGIKNGARFVLWKRPSQ